MKLKKSGLFILFIACSFYCHAQFGNVNQMLQQQQRQLQQQQLQLQQQMNQTNRMAQHATANVQSQQTSDLTFTNVPAGFFTFTKLNLNQNAKDADGRALLKCSFSFRVSDPRYNTLKPVLFVECPKGTLHTDVNGQLLKYAGNPINTIGINIDCNGWLGFYKDALNPLPGTNTYYACIRVYSSRTGSYVAQSKYLTFTMTGEQPEQQVQHANNQQKESVKESPKQQPEMDVIAQQNKEPQQEELSKYAPISQRISLKAGTRIAMQAIDELAVADANEGDLIDFQVSEDVMVNGFIAIPKGTKGKAEVLTVSATGILNQEESMHITPVYILLPNNEEIPLKKKKIKIAGVSARWSSLGGNRGVLKKGYSLRCEVASNTNVFAYTKVTPTNQAPKSSIANNTDVSSPVTGKSDIDQNIPTTGVSADNTFAVIIANENYAVETQVEYAINDGRAFKEYCRKTLGLPDLNIHYSENATKNNIVAEIDWISKVAEAFGSDAKVIIYYAGHGIPDEQTGNAYLLPVDGVGTNVKTGYALSILYEQLSALPASNVTVLMDACFSGTKRGEGMLTNARGVAIKSNASAPKGNLVVFSAAQGDETAYPYKEKGHGLFTYFLLKKLQESKGNCTLSELNNYVKQQVARHSILVNGKSQTPTVTASPALGDSWKAMRLK